MSILIEINNGQPIPLMWYIFILLFFKLLASVNIAKILTTGPRLGPYILLVYIVDDQTKDKLSHSTPDNL